MRSGRVKLKRITLSGFKSFADKKSILFGEGINAVVGPNGCGKSNIADAFRWVLGEQSARSLRGGKMEDILFSGTEKRRALNMAEVTLVFDNEAKELSLPYTEIEITRRIYRGGDSEYLICQNQVRLKDVQALMMEMSLGKNPYVIFEQGKIDQIVMMSPEERRGLFEEAAGIVCFLVSKKETLKKLDEAKGHILRVQDLMRESDRQIALLQKEAEEAEKVLALKNEILDLEKKHLLARVAEKRVLLSKKVEGEEKLLIKSKEIFNQKELAEREKEGLVTEISLKRPSLDRLRDQISSLDKEVSLAAEKRKSLFEKKEAIEKELPLHQKFLSGRVSERMASENKRIALQKGIESEGELLKKGEEELKVLLAERKKGEEALAAARKRLDEAQTEALVLLRKEGDAKGERKRSETVLEISKSRLVQLNGQLRELEEVKERADAAEKELSDKKKLLFEEKKGADEQEASLKEKVKAFTLREKELVDLLQDIERALSKEQASLFALKKIEKSWQGTQDGIARLLAQFPFLQPIQEIWSDIQDPVYQTLLTRYEKSLVVPDYEKRKIVLAWAKEEKINGFSLICEVHKGLFPEVRYEKIDGAEIDKKGSEVIYDKEEALYIDEQGVLFSPFKGAALLFDRTREIHAVEMRVAQAEEKKKERLLQKEALIREKKELISSLEEATKKVHHLEKKIVEHHFLQEKNSSEKKRALQEESRLLLESKKVESDRNRAEEFLKSHGPSELNSGGDSFDQQNRHLESLKRQLQEKISQLGPVKKAHEEKAHYLWTLQSGRDQKKQLLEVVLHQEKEGEKQTAYTRERLEALAEEKVHILQELAKSEITLQEKSPLFQELKAKEAEARGALQKEEGGLQEVEKKLTNLLKEEMDMRELQHAIELAKSTLTAEIKTLHDEYENRFSEEVPSSDIGLLSIEGIEKSVNQKRQDLAGFGEVNFAAAETLKTESERRSDLAAKVDDLLLAESQLKAFLQELENKSRLLFEETFERIRAAFQKNFSLLFEGGEADLVREGDDVLSSKIHILARPPGKKLQSITLLSGGERCLTSMALLFSIFEARISPFCILDEIDAPLDEANVDRLTHLLDQFSEKTQFIVITHNKRTMEKSDRLFGVTMQEKGVSTLVAVEFSNKEEVLQ